MKKEITVENEVYLIDLDNLLTAIRSIEEIIKGHKEITRQPHTQETRYNQYCLSKDKPFATFLYTLRAYLRGRQHCYLEEPISEYLDRWLRSQQGSVWSLYESPMKKIA